ICESALVSLEKVMVNDDLLQTAYLEALNTGRPMLALRFLNACTPGHINRPEAFHTRACAAAQLGYHERALESIAAALPREEDPVSYLIDAHLAPMWYHYASTTPRLWEAEILNRPEFARLARVCRSETNTRSICWNTAQTCLPKDILPTLTRDWTLYVSPGPRASLAQRRRYTHWLNERRRRMARVLRRAIQRAWVVTLAAETLPAQWIKTPIYGGL
ncbi:MAG: hypothetical protein K8R87_14150, partial [Verrucomicrobia bacterium]|nr:hypothetical protein [Verrucomicrobiota bacterium]